MLPTNELRIERLGRWKSNPMLLVDFSSRLGGFETAANAASFVTWHQALATGTTLHAPLPSVRFASKADTQSNLTACKKAWLIYLSSPVRLCEAQCRDSPCWRWHPQRSFLTLSLHYLRQFK